MEKILLAWSGGKDSTLAFYELRKTNSYKIISLLTTVTEDYDRISMHGVRRDLLEQQAESLNLPLEKVYIPKECSNEEYEMRMAEKLLAYKEKGILEIAFGDIFLEDLRKYREENLAKLGMKAIFPLWQKDSFQLAHAFIDLGFKAVITCLDSKFLDRSFIGRIYDKEFLQNLPAHVDPCGEHGEFHSFVYAGPIFPKEIPFTKGEI
ncbi:MAG: diphthine--ammonia ligase, partial [Thermodesulfobacteriota bacterium]